MNALNFIPLLGWALGCMALGIWDDHLRKIDGRKPASTVDGGAFGEIYLGGCVGFFLVGVASAAL